MTAWDDAKTLMGNERVHLGPQASHQWLEAPDHLAMVLARYRAAAALIGTAARVLELGCGEGIGAGILARDRRRYAGVDTDLEALDIACVMYRGRPLEFVHGDVLGLHAWSRWDAVVALDVIEHVQPGSTDRFFRTAVDHLDTAGVLVVGTPNAAFDYLASPQSRAGHVNLFTHDRLVGEMAARFRVVQSLGMQDTSLHLGHPEARHYLLVVGVCPR